MNEEAITNKLTAGEFEDVYQFIEMAEKAKIMLPIYFAGLMPDLFESNIHALEDAANKDWGRARFYLLALIALERIPENSREYIDTQVNFWNTSKDSIVNEELEDGVYGYTQNSELLLAIAEKDWGCSRDTVIEGLTNGWYGFEKDPIKASELKNKWIIK